MPACWDALRDIFNLPQYMAIIGRGNLAKLYAQALAIQGIYATIADDQKMTLGGLIATYTCLNNP